MVFNIYAFGTHSTKSDLQCIWSAFRYMRYSSFVSEETSDLGFSAGNKMWTAVIFSICPHLYIYFPNSWAAKSQLAHPDGLPPPPVSHSQAKISPLRPSLPLFSISGPDNRTENNQTTMEKTCFFAMTPHNTHTRDRQIGKNSYMFLCKTATEKGSVCEGHFLTTGQVLQFNTN